MSLRWCSFLLLFTLACSGGSGEGTSDVTSLPGDKGLPPSGDTSTDVLDDGSASDTNVSDTTQPPDGLGQDVDVYSDGAEVSTDTSLPCAPCEEGLSLNELDCSCSDIDECAVGKGGCSEYAACTNAEVSGESALCLCNEGYFGDGFECQAWKSCLDDEYESVQPTAVTDRVCSVRSVVPGVIEAEDYGEGQVEGFYRDASPGNDGGVYREDDVDIYPAPTGFVVEMQSGEWLRYPIYVPEAGRYRLSLLARSDTRGRSLNIYLGDVALGLGVSLTDSDAPLELRSVEFEAGPHTIEVSGGTLDGVIIDALEFSECIDEDGDGFCAIEDCAVDDSSCARGLCCRSLVAHWAFDENSGITVADSSSEGNDGVISSVQGSSWVPGVLGNALMFDSDTEVLVQNAPSLEVGMTYSFATWFKATEGPSGHVVEFNNQTNAWVRFENHRLQIMASHTGSGNWPHYAAKATTAYPLEGWHHMVVVVSDTELWIYIDGVLDAGRVVLPYGSSTDSSPLILGKYLAGTLDDTRIYDDLLNKEDVAELYTEQASQLTQCNDGIDNDGNGLSDMGDDPACSSSYDDKEETDLDAPGVPEELVVVEIVPHMAHLSWSSSIDDGSLGGYHIYRDGRRVDTVMRPVFYDTSVVEGGSHSYYVTAMDHAGRESGTSNEVVVEIPVRPTFPDAETVMVSPGSYVSSTGVPFNTVHDLAAASSEGTTFIFEPGIYRLAKTIYPLRGQSFIGKPGATFSGAITPESGDIQVVDGLYRWSNLNLPNTSCSDPGFCLLIPRGACETSDDCAFNETCEDDGLCYLDLSCEGPCAERPVECHRCKYRNDLFFNDQVLTRVVHKEDVVPGSFFVEYAGAATTVYFLDDPTNQKVELSVLRNAISGSPNEEDCSPDCNAHVTIKGLIIEKFGSVAQRGAINAREQDYTGKNMLYWTIEQNQIRWNHGNGVSAGNYARLRNNKIYGNGQMGGRISDHGVQEGNEFSGNNYAGYQPAWEAGASKIVASTYTIIRGNYVHNNLGHGLWTDIDNQHVVFEDNVATYNDGDGIKHEISYDCAIRRNASMGNSNSRVGWLFGSAILVQNSTNCDVYGNQIQVDSLGNGLNVLNQDRTHNDVDYYGVDNTVHRNRISYSSGSGKSGANFVDNMYDYNVYDAPERFVKRFGGWSGTIWRRFVDTGSEVNGSLDILGTPFEVLLAAPSVQWVAPSESGDLGCGGDIDLEVHAEAAKGDRVARVEYFLNDVFLAQTSHRPYRVQWYYPTPGAHELKAVVHTMRDQSKESVSISVLIPGDCP